MRSRRRLLPATALMLAASAVLPAAGPAAAVVLFPADPTPAPASPPAGGRVVIDWAGVAMTFPETWTVRPKRAPGIMTAGASILVAFGPEQTICMLDRYDPDAIETWQDVGIEPVTELTLDGRLVERFDDMLGSGASRASAYTIHAPGFLYSLLCSSADPPDDRWLSLVETIEL